MTSEEYIRKMMGLTNVLADLDPSDPEQKKAWDLAVAQIHLTVRVWNRSRRWRLWPVYLKIALLVALLAFVVCTIVC